MHIPEIHEPLPEKNVNRKHPTILRPNQLHTGPIHPNQSKTHLRSCTIGVSLDGGHKLGTHACLPPQVLALLRPITLDPAPEGLLLGGGTPGTTPPLTLDLALAQLTRPHPRHHPHDEGVLDRLFSSMCSGGMIEGQLRRRSLCV